MVPQEISCPQHEVLLSCLFPSSGNTSATPDNSTASPPSSAAPGNFEDFLCQPLVRGFLSFRSCRDHRQRCVPLPRGHALVKNCGGSSCGSLEHGQGRRQALVHPGQTPSRIFFGRTCRYRHRCCCAAPKEHCRAGHCGERNHGLVGALASSGSWCCPCRTGCTLKGENLSFGEKCMCW